MHVINYISKVQAIDKSLALLSELRTRLPDLSIVHIINIEAQNQIPSCQDYFELMAELGDSAIVIEGSRQSKEAGAIFEDTGMPYTSVPVAPDESRHSAAERIWEAVVKPPARTCLLVPFTSEGSGLVTPLMAGATRRRAKVVAYFKSVHDQGMGLTAEASGRTGATKTTFRRARHMWRRASRSASIADQRFDERFVDVVLAFNNTQRKLLLSKGYSPRQVAVMGYPLLYPAWKGLVARSSFCRGFGKSMWDVVLFTRGETPGRPSNQNIVTNDDLIEYLDDIFAIMEDLTPHAKLRIKPHPIQDASVIQNYLSKRTGTVSAAMSFEPPFLLAGVCDLAISTYSSTVLDALIQDVPSVEYLKENAFFRKKHPTGSPFPSLGALRANNREELREHVSRIHDGWRPPRVLEDRFGHRLQNSVLENVFSRS